MIEQKLWTACVTPFLAEEKGIDWKSLMHLLYRQEEAGNGILLLGSTGEALSLSWQERRALIEKACSLELQVPILVGVPAATLEESLAWIDFCNSLPLAGYLIAPPSYSKPGAWGQIHWFTALLNRAHHPVMLYNIPSRTGVSLLTQAVCKLKSHEQLVAIKEASGTLESLISYQNVAPHLSLFCGEDRMLPAAVAMGACGWVSVSANLWPTAASCYLRELLSGHFPEPTLWWNAHTALSSASNPIPVKALLSDLQLICSYLVRSPLDSDDLPSLDPLRKAHRAISEWEKKKKIQVHPL